MRTPSLLFRAFVPLLATLVCELLGGAAKGQCVSGPPRTLGTVLWGGTLPYTGSLPRTRIEAVRVDCDGLASEWVGLQISEPPANTVVRGTVISGSGGYGTALSSLEVHGQQLFQRLQAMGFRLIDRFWQTGWFGGAVSLRKQSCRYATLLDYIHRTYHTSGAFCAIGFSGGSSEIGYALTTWGSDAHLDVAVLISGPAMSRLDLVCGTSSPEWANQCAQLMTLQGFECAQVACQANGTFGICTSCSQQPTVGELREDSIMHPNAVLAYPKTRVHFLLGAQDCGYTVPAALMFHGAIQSEKVVEVVPGVDHFVAHSPQGLEALVRAVVGGATTRPGPATLAFVRFPQIGTVARLQVHGPAAQPFLVAQSTASALVEVPALGWVFIGPPTRLVGAGALGPSGRAEVLLPVPSLPALVGLELFHQAMLGSWLSNQGRIEIMP